MAFALSLRLDGAAAPGWLMESLDSATVTRSDQAPAGFQLTFTAALGSRGSEYAVLAMPELQSGKRVAVCAGVNGASQVLIDGYVTHVELQPPAAGREAQVVVTGEDVSILMDLYEYSLEYPLMPDFAIAGTVLLKWIAAGVTPRVHPTPTSGLSFTTVPQQNSTDRKYLKELAGAHGYVFYVEPGASPGDNVAYWGPPPRDDAPQPPLSVDQDPMGAVSEISFTYDATAPERTWGAVLDTMTNLVVPILIEESTRTGELAAAAPLDASPHVMGIPFLRTNLFDHQGLGVVTSFARAQAIVNVASDAAATAQGRLDVLRYGRPLQAPGVVPLRGAGAAFDGLYYVQKVQHTLSRTAWTQSFVLTREGLQTTIDAVDAA